MVSANSRNRKNIKFQKDVEEMKEHEWEMDPQDSRMVKVDSSFGRRDGEM